jgi:hypothetical protein
MREEEGDIEIENNNMDGDSSRFALALVKSSPLRFSLSDGPLLFHRLLHGAPRYVLLCRQKSQNKATHNLKIS